MKTRSSQRASLPANGFAFRWCRLPSRGCKSAPWRMRRPPRALVREVHRRLVRRQSDCGEPADGSADSGWVADDAHHPAGGVPEHRFGGRARHRALPGCRAGGGFGRGLRAHRGSDRRHARDRSLLVQRQRRQLHGHDRAHRGERSQHDRRRDREQGRRYFDLPRRDGEARRCVPRAHAGRDQDRDLRCRRRKDPQSSGAADARRIGGAPGSLAGRRRVHTAL